jgi:hypothetical protein
VRKVFLILAIAATLAGVGTIGYGVWLVPRGNDVSEASVVQKDETLPTVGALDGIGAIGIGASVAFCGGLMAVSLCRKRE